MAINAMGPQGPGDEVGEVTHDMSSIQAVSSESIPETDKNRSALRNSRNMEEEEMEGGQGVVVRKKEEEVTFSDASETRMVEEKTGVAPEDLSSGMQVQQAYSEDASFSPEQSSFKSPAEVQVEDIPVPEIVPIVVHRERDVLEPQRSIHKRSSPLHRRHLVTFVSSSSPPPPRSALHSALASAFAMAASGLALSFVVISYSMYSRRREKSPLGFFHYLTQGVFDSSYSFSHPPEASSLLPVATIPSPMSATEEPEIAVSSCAQVTPSASYKADVGRRASRQLLESKVEHLY
ncbi:hypothetical protein BG000_011254 [Podila horticola]|nr:hypothetical protein BG000_011254 [Podila horticola]